MNLSRFVLIRGWKLKVTCLILLSVFMLPGCGNWKKGIGINTQYDVLIVVDHSGSVRTNHTFNKTVQQISQVYLNMLRTGPHNEVSLQHGGVVNEILYDGKGKGLVGLQDKLNSLANGKNDDDSPISQPSLSSGKHVVIDTDPHDALDGLGNGTRIVETELKPAEDWINNQPRNDQIMVIIISDLIADPTKYTDHKAPTYYLDPAKFEWTVKNPKHVHLRFYMVGYHTKHVLQTVWKHSGIDMRFFHAGYTVDQSDINSRTN